MALFNGLQEWLDARPRAPRAHEARVVGVVGPSGATIVTLAEPSSMAVEITLVHWRLADGPLRSGRLTLRQPVARERMWSLARRVGAHPVVECFVVRSTGDEAAAGTLQMTRVVGPVEADRELHALARRLDTLADPQFGAFALDRANSRYTATTTWLGASLTLDLALRGEPSADGALAAARTLWSEGAAWDARVRARIVADLLPMKNGSWLDEGEPPLDERQFNMALTIESIEVGADGLFDIYLDDGGLFAEHTIHVSGSLRDGPDEAQILG